jgi:hypothetical protein
MTIDLSTYTSIGSALLVKIDYINEFGDSAQVLFSDYYKTLTLSGNVYNSLGSLMTITETSQELRAASNDLTVSISGIPTENISLALRDKTKGSLITIQRVIFNPVTGAVLSIAGNPAGRFQGLIDNVSLSEDYDVAARTATNTITFICTSVINQIERKVSGRRTNPVDQKLLYAGDLGFDRVPNIANTNFNFGAPV